VSLIDGAVRYRTEWEIGGLPVKVPAVDVHTVGAGGGSLAFVDAGGALKVGPQSAGADPGPACYGTGTEPTVTDANVVLGRVVAENFLGGRMPLDVRRAREALTRLGAALGLSAEAAADGVVRVVNAGMERAIRRISVERGYDPRQYALIAFGGAAGQHACELAAALGIRHVVVPRDPGLLSAWGAASADVQRDHVQTVRLVQPTPGDLRRLFAPLEVAAMAALRDEGIPSTRRTCARSLDLRYVGQSHELDLPFTVRFADAFHAAHRRLYGYADPQRPIEVVNLRVLARGAGPHPRDPEWHAAGHHRAAPHRVRWGGRWVTAAAWPRYGLSARAVHRGPLVLTEFSATTFVPSGWRVRAHPTGHLELLHAD